MSKQKVAQQQYAVSIYGEPDSQGGLRFTFVPKGPQAIRPDGEQPQPPSQYIVSVRGYGDATAFNWINPAPGDAVREELEKTARDRVTARQEWLQRLNKLVRTVKEWADSMGWSTKIVEKKMTDSEIGTYKAPALVLQEESVKLFLEPVARSAPGTEGIVDLYIMPSYDDVANLYYYADKWNLHYTFQGRPSIGNIDAEARPFTKATLGKVFEEMKAHAS